MLWTLTQNSGARTSALFPHNPNPRRLWAKLS
jgi:hypothetical protein